MHATSHIESAGCVAAGLTWRECTPHFKMLSSMAPVECIRMAVRHPREALAPHHGAHWRAVGSLITRLCCLVVAHWHPLQHNVTQPLWVEWAPPGVYKAGNPKPTHINSYNGAAHCTAEPCMQSGFQYNYRQDSEKPISAVRIPICSD